jgi:hypothetical protein
MIYIENTKVRTAKSEIYLGNMGFTVVSRHSPSGMLADVKIA